MEWKNNEANAKYSSNFNKKRKKKKSFLSKQRSQGKKGKFGRGTEISGDTFSYFLRVLEVNLADFTTPEDREIFIDNVFEQTTGKEVVISCNQLGSRVMEKFLPWANDKILLRFTYTFFLDMRKICCDEFGSHVMQQLVVVVSAFLQKTENAKEEHAKSQPSIPDLVVRYNNWLVQICKFVVNNVQEFMQDKYANHIIRTVLECLSGLPAGSTSKEKKKAKEKKPELSTLDVETSPIKVGPSLVQDIANRILEMSQIVDLVYSDLTSGLLQTLLVAVHRVDHKLFRKFLRHLLDNVFDPYPQEFSEELGNEKKKKKLNMTRVPEIFMSSAATHLMDVMISISSKKLFTQIYARCFINKLHPLSLAPDANFCVQNLIRHCTEKLEFDGIFDELSTNFEALLYYKKHGVLLALGQSCLRLNSRQGQFMKELQKALHCIEADRLRLFPLLVACLVNYETWCEQAEGDIHKLPISLQGCLLLETLLSFPETIQIIKAMLNMSCQHFKLLLCDFRGSYVADAFFASKTVGEKSKDKFYRKLQGSYVELAVSKYGSRVLDAVWAWAPSNCKKLILEELAPSEAMINGFQWGNIFTEKSGLSLFKRRPKDWEESQSRGNRKQKLFADIIGT